VDRALREALALVVDLLGLRTGWVWLIDPQTNRFYSAAAQNLPPFLSDPVRMTGRRCWCIDAFRSGELTAENIDVIECSRLRAALGRTRETRGLRYHASIPLTFGTRQLGIMNVATRAWRKLTRRELDLLSTIASQVGVAIERARLAETSVGAARTEERARLARDLHDTLTQGLTAIGLHIEAAMANLAQHDGARRELERALDVTRANLGEARRALHDLRGSALGGRPLTEALAALCRQVTADSGIRVRFESTLTRPLDPTVEEGLFRIAGEALANVRRHAQAADVRVSLSGARGRAALTIADDGRGFAVKRARGGFGIEGMRERTRLLGGRFALRSAIGRGTTIDIIVPNRGQPAADRGRRREP
jgi:two-component system, NarL family, sensor kinase